MSKPSHKPPCIFWYILRAKPLTSYMAKCIKFSRLPLLCPYFPAENSFKRFLQPGNCRVDNGLYRQTDATCPHNHRFSPLCHMLQPTRSFFCPPAIPNSDSHPDFPLFLKRKTHPRLTHVDESRILLSCFLLHATGEWNPMGIPWNPWESHVEARRTKTIDQRPVLDLHFAPPALLHVLLLVLFLTDTWQKKTPAPHRHFDHSYSTSVTASVINKHLLEYNHFFLGQAVFRNEITIITSKNMYE